MTDRLLIVDNDRARRRETIDALTELYPQAEMLEAADADEAEALWRDHAPTLAALAFDLAGETGLEIAERLRGRNASAKLMLYSASVPESVRREAAKISCALIESPVTAEKVVAALDACAAAHARVDSKVAAQAFA